jgi:acetyltransferase-like isoleucine patch superfamily enzyme
MNFNAAKLNRSHGSGTFSPDEFYALGINVVFEPGVLVFHPGSISIGNNVYIGHNTILKGYYNNQMQIGDDTWIGQNCFFHSAGGISIGRAVGIGPYVKIITSVHADNQLDMPVLFHPVSFRPVSICDGADIGVGSVVLPGVTIGEGAIIGAGAVVTRNVTAYAVAAGVPAKVLRMRGGLPDSAVHQRGT